MLLQTDLELESIYLSSYPDLTANYFSFLLIGGGDKAKA